MNNVLNSSTPRFNWGGTKDVSGKKIQKASDSLPFFRPIWLTYAKRGRVTPTYLPTNELVKEYGQEILDRSSKYGTMSTPFISEGVSAQCRQMIVRIEPGDSETATLAISLEVLETDVPLYERNDEGRYVIKNGKPVPTGTTTPGRICRWILEVIQKDQDGVSTYSSRAITPGTMGDGQSKIIPIVDMKVSDFGEYGNNVAMRMWAPTVNSRLNPIDTELMDDIHAYPYYFSLLERENAFGTPEPLGTINETTVIPFSLKEDALAVKRGGLVYDLAYAVKNNYSEDTDEYQTRSPIEEPFVYQDNVNALVAAIQATESKFDTIDEDPELMHTVNLLGATTPEGTPYHSFVIEGIGAGGASMSETATHYFLGGADGTMGDEALAAAYAKLGDDFIVNGFNIDRAARYPFNVVWDPGLPLETKMKVSNTLTLGRVFLGLCTQDITRKPNDLATDDASALAIIANLAQYPDSLEFRTPAFRGTLVGGVGDWVASRKTIKVPVSIDLYYKFCLYGRNENGKLDGENAFDEDEKKIITRVKNISNLDRGLNSKRRSWESGMCYAEDWDIRRQMFAAVQSFYNDPTSVLNSAIVGLTIANMWQWCFEVWRSLVGNQKLTKEQLVERSDKLINQKTVFATDGRCDVIPHSVITGGDALRGYSWSCPVDVYANGMPTVMNASVIAYRREDLNG